jgi:hypothetical protein
LAVAGVGIFLLIVAGIPCLVLAVAWVAPIVAQYLLAVIEMMPMVCSVGLVVFGATIAHLIRATARALAIVDAGRLFVVQAILSVTGVAPTDLAVAGRLATVHRRPVE